MAEQGKPPQGLNLGAARTNTRDQNAPNAKPDNSEQTRVRAPAAASTEESGRAAILAEQTTPEQRRELRKPTVIGASDPTGAARQRLDSDEVDNSVNDSVGDELAAQRAVDRAGVATADSDETIYTSSPADNFRLGRFKFENGVLRLKGEDLDDFEKLLNDPRLPRSDRSMIRKIDMSRVDAIVEARRQATTQFDSSLGREALERLHRESPTVGTVPLGFEARPQQDHNVPVQPTPPVEPAGEETGRDMGAHTAPEDSEGVGSANKSEAGAQ